MTVSIESQSYVTIKSCVSRHFETYHSTVCVQACICLPNHLRPDAYRDLCLPIVPVAWCIRLNTLIKTIVCWLTILWPTVVCLCANIFTLAGCPGTVSCLHERLASNHWPIVLKALEKRLQAGKWMSPWRRIWSWVMSRLATTAENPQRECQKIQKNKQTSLSYSSSVDSQRLMLYNWDILFPSSFTNSKQCWFVPQFQKDINRAANLT